MKTFEKFDFCPAPEGPPLDMQLQALSSHSIQVTWKVKLQFQVKGTVLKDKWKDFVKNVLPAKQSFLNYFTFEK